MLDTGYNHQYVYILGQGPVFEALGYFIRRKLRGVCKWLNQYVTTDIEDRAQRVIRLAFIRIKLYRAMCLSCWPITPERFLHFAGGAEVGVDAAHVCRTPFYNRALCFLSINEYSSNRMIRRFTNKKLADGALFLKAPCDENSLERWNRVKQCLLSADQSSLTSPNDWHSFAESAKYYTDQDNEYNITRAHDHIKYVSLRILGGTNRRVEAYVDWCPYIVHNIDDASLYVRIFVNLPTVEMACSTLHYSIYGFGSIKSKFAQLGTHLNVPIRQMVGSVSYANTAHKFIIEEYDDNGVLLHKKVYYRTVFFLQYKLFINNNESIALTDYLKHF